MNNNFRYDDAKKVFFGLEKMFKKHNVPAVEGFMIIGFMLTAAAKRLDISQEEIFLNCVKDIWRNSDSGYVIGENVIKFPNK